MFDWQRLNTNVSFSEKMFLTKHLAVMLKSGLTLTESIEVISQQTSNSGLKSILNRLNKSISEGKKLSDAMNKYGWIFNPMYINLVRIGEESGNLEKNLEQLAEQQKRDYVFRQKVNSALMYPSIVLSATMIVGIGLSLFVLPKVIDLFLSLGGDLPLSTKILIGFATLMRDYGYVVLASIVGLFIAFRLILLVAPVRLVWQKFLLSMPVIGKFIKNLEMTVFCRNMGVMMASGLPITVCLTNMIEVTKNLVFLDYFKRLRVGVDEGESMEKILSDKRFYHFPGIAKKMIGVGENSGKLEESFLYLADFFEEEVDDLSKNFSTILEPVLLLVIGGVVAFVAIAIISPIYQFTGSVGR